MDLERLYHDQVLFGTDPTTALVAVERSRQDTVLVYRRQLEVPGQPVQVTEVPLDPFCLVRDEAQLLGQPGIRSVERLSGNHAYRYLVRGVSFSAMSGLVRRLREHGAGRGMRQDAVIEVADPAGQYLLLTGRTLFKGMAFSQLRRLQLDLEVYSSEPGTFPSASREGDRIIVASLCDNTGWECVLSGVELSEPALIQALVDAVVARDPDVIEGHNLFRFDLPYLEHRARRHGVALTLGRDGSRISRYSSRFGAGERAMPYERYSIAGRHVVDTFFLALLHDVSQRSLESYGLKDLARAFGVASPNRTYVDGSQISWTFDHQPERLLEYALDDVRETRAISDLLLAPYFFQAQIFPMSLQDVTVRGTATRIDRLLLRAYVHERASVPEGQPGEAQEGGYTALKRQGVLRDVLHCDVRSLYPSVMGVWSVGPRSDDLGIFSHLLATLRTLRLEARSASKHAPTEDERQHADALQLTFKVLINSFYGYLGASIAHFNDMKAAGEVTARGRALIQQMMAFLEAAGASIIEVDTDGIYFQPPVELTTEAAQEALIARLNDTLPDGIDCELDGRYPAMFSYKIKNYVLLEPSGRLTVRGSGLRSRAVERFQRQFMEGLFERLLTGRAHELGALFHQYHRGIARHEWPLAWFVKRETLGEPIEAYQKRVKARKRAPSAAYELARRSGRALGPGDVVTYYVGGRDARVKVFEAARWAADWREEAPDENVAYYQSKLEELYRKFEPFIVQEGGPSLASLLGGQVMLPGIYHSGGPASRESGPVKEQ